MPCASEDGGGDAGMEFSRKDQNPSDEGSRDSRQEKTTDGTASLREDSEPSSGTLGKRSGVGRVHVCPHQVSV